MDIIAHGLWAGTAAQGINMKKKKPLKFWIMAFFGVFPDLFAFSLPFLWYWSSLIISNIPKITPPKPSAQIVDNPYSLWVIDIVYSLYNISHSLFIFFLVFGLIWLIRRKPLWEMGGWFLHILLDIPSHTFDFFPTPFLWPFSDFMVDGVRWASRSFIITNYSLLIVTYIVIYLLKKRKEIVK